MRCLKSRGVARQAYKLKKDDKMSGMAVHPVASLIATASPNQFVKIFNLEGELLSQHKHYTNFLGDCIGMSNSFLVGVHHH